jgi:hypothetical protein
MATEEQKKTRQMKLFNEVIFGLAKGMWELFGEGAFALSTEIGEEILEEMEHDMGLEIQGETPQDILTEIERIYVDEVGGALAADLKIKDDRIDVFIEGCILKHACTDLQKEGIKPFTCVPMMLAAAALRERLGLKEQLDDIVIKGDKCDIDFVLV